VTLQGSGRDVQFKAQLLGTVPEDAGEIQLVVESMDASR
jgi:hypothetical protein